MTDDRNETLLRALACGATGNLDEAERLLDGTDDESRSIPELDLLARIAVQQGDDIRAATLWRRVLSMEPDNAAAHSALARLRTPWRTRERIRRMTAILLPTVLAVSILVCIIFIYHYHHRTNKATSRIRQLEDVVAHLPQLPDIAVFHSTHCAATTTPAGDVQILFNTNNPSATQLKELSAILSIWGRQNLIVSEAGPSTDRNGKRTTNWIGIRRAVALSQSLMELTGLPASHFAVAETITTNAQPLTVRLARHLSGEP